MFTGLVEAVGELVERAPIEGGVRLKVATALAGELALGDSLAMNGVCLTVVRAENGVVSAEVGPETMRVTTLATLPEGAPINLERPLRADGRLGGHFVQGHVDGIGFIEAFKPERDFHWLTVAFPTTLAPLMVHRGSIAVDGISLTIAAISGNHFDVQIVPYTIQHTNLRRASVNDGVNLECDLIGKYVVRAASLSGWSLIGVPPGQVTH